MGENLDNFRRRYPELQPFLDPFQINISIGKNGGITGGLPLRLSLTQSVYIRYQFKYLKSFSGCYMPRELCRPRLPFRDEAMPEALVRQHPSQRLGHGVHIFRIGVNGGIAGDFGQSTGSRY